MKLQDVINNVSSIANLLTTILAFFCRKYNNYMVNVDFIQKNVRYKVKEKDEERILKTILDLEEEQLPVPVENESQPPDAFKMIMNKKNLRPSKKIIMKSYFDLVLCCKRKESTRNLLSDAAQNFFKELVDVNNIIVLLSQLNELKNASLKDYQKIVLDRTKIVMKLKEIMEMNDDDPKY